MSNAHAQRLPRTAKPNTMRDKRRAIPAFMPLSILVYPDPDNEGRMVAHCLEFDVIGYGDSVEDSMLRLLSLVDSHIFACEQAGADIWFPAPGDIWRKFVAAVKANRKIPDELNDRILAQTEVPCGYLRRRNLENTLSLGNVVATQEVYECLAANA